MGTDKSGKTPDENTLDLCLRALYEKDRLGYAGRFVQGFVHNANGPLQNLTMLTEMVLSGLDMQDRMFRNGAGQEGDADKWSEIHEKQRKRITQMREQIANLAGDLREFMQLHETERNAADIDLNALLTRMMRVFRSDLFFKHKVTSELNLTRNLPHVRVLGRHMIPALFHLFQNAMTAMQDSPRKEFSVSTSMTDGEIQVRFTDSGPGLPPGEDPESLFGLFESKWPESESTLKSANLGFGLYAARQLLAPYGIAVALETESGKEGVSAVIRIPLKSDQA